MLPVRELWLEKRPKKTTSFHNSKFFETLLLAIIARAAQRAKTKPKVD